jgi:hypothetical protein
MRYMLLLYRQPDAGPAPGSPEEAASMPQWMAYGQALAEAGAMISGDALHGVDTATTVRRDGDELVTTDGPFAETKETLGGYYVIDVPDLDAAIAWADKCPLIEYGTVEIRPLVDFD